MTTQTASNSTNNKKALIPFFLLTYLITWGLGAFAIFLPEQFQHIFGELSDTSPMYYLAVTAPTISATLVILVGEGWRGVGRLYACLFHWRVGLQWYALVLIGIPALGWLITRVTGAAPLKDVSTPGLLLPLLLSLLISGPLGEELGWRGFALPKLLNRFSPLGASLLLGIIWGVWHLPSFFISGMVQSSLSLPIFLVSTPCLSILVTWVFMHTNGSVLIAVLIHYMVNFCASIIGVPAPVMAACMLVGVVLVLTLDRKTSWFRGPGTGKDETSMQVEANNELPA